MTQFKKIKKILLVICIGVLTQNAEAREVLLKQQSHTFKAIQNYQGVQVDQAEFNSLQSKTGAKVETMTLEEAAKLTKGKAVIRKPASCGTFGSETNKDPSSKNWLRAFGGSGDGALVFLLVVGLVVMVMWIVYALTYFLQYLFGKCRGEGFLGAQLFGRYSDFPSSLDSDGDTLKQDAISYGIQMSAALTSKKRLGLGLALELGRQEFKQKNVASGFTNKINGNYFLLGPKLIYNWKSSNSYTYMDFLGGTSERNDIGLMSSWRLGMSIGTKKAPSKKGVKFDLFSGVDYVELKKARGLAREFDKPGWLLGAAIGFQI